MNPTTAHIRNFWCKVDRRGDDECWLWTGAIQSRGYGSLSINGKTYNAHRVSFLIHYGYIPEGLVLHSCDNRRCVNPKHIREGTHLDNVRDMLDRGRANMSGLKYSGKFYR